MQVVGVRSTARCIKDPEGCRLIYSVRLTEADSNCGISLLTESWVSIFLNYNF